MSVVATFEQGQGHPNIIRQHLNLFLTKQAVSTICYSTVYIQNNLFNVWKGNKYEDSRMENLSPCRKIND